MKHLIIVYLILCNCYCQISFCSVSDVSRKVCLVCQPKYKLTAERDGCEPMIANCLVYDNHLFTSCDYCE